MTKTAVSEQTILLIDDEELVLNAIQLTLRSESYRVIPALTGKNAIDAIANNPTGIDLILIDFGLPDMPGEDVLKYMNHHNVDIPVVICSGRVVHEELLPVRPVATLMKPYTVDQLLDVLNQALS